MVVGPGPRSLVARRWRRELPEPPSDSPFIGAHAVAIVGCDPDADRFRFANSWGTRWGDGGFGRVARATLERVVAKDDIWAIDATLFVWGT
jgi:C1A family cysteine protease